MYMYVLQVVQPLIDPLPHIFLLARKRHCTCILLMAFLLSSMMMPPHPSLAAAATTRLHHDHDDGDDDDTEATLLQDAMALDMFVDELPRMPILHGFCTETSHGHVQLVPNNLTIGMYLKQWKFHRDLLPSQVFAYGESEEEATVPGPTIVAMHGVKTYVRWENHLPNHHIFDADDTIGGPSLKKGIPTVVHLHGGMSEPKSDGNALAWFTRDFEEKGPKWTNEVYEYTNVKETSNLWYHDHADALTRLNLLAGLVGAYKVINPILEHEIWKLPHERFDIELVIMDRSFTKNGQIYINSTGDNPDIHPEWQPEYFGDVVLVNGKAWPYLKVQRRKYRFRIINASNARFYRLALDNGMHFTQIGADSFYFEKPIHLNKVLVAPSEIIDVVVDFSTSKSRHIIMTNDAVYPFPDGDPVNDRNGKVMKFVVGRQSAFFHDESRIPNKLVEVQKLSLNNSVTTRNITLYEFDSSSSGEPTHLLINFKKFTDTVTEKPKIGTTEVWRIINLTPDNHPFHVHLTGFQVVYQQRLKDVDKLSACVLKNRGIEDCELESYLYGPLKPPHPNEAGWKNVFKMKPSYVTTIILRFALPSGQPFPFDPTGEPGYTYHCHILDHEDNAMMRPYEMTL